MELPQLYGFALLIVAVGMLLGVGVLTLDKFSSGVYADNSYTEKTLAFWTNNYTTLTKSTVTASGYSALNATNAVAVSLEFDSSSKWSATKAKLPTDAAASLNGTLVNVTYTYGSTSAANTALNAVRTEVSGISTTWLGLIVTVAVLALILGLVISSFGGRRD